MRLSRLQIFDLITINLLLLCPALVRSQTVMATIPIANDPTAVAVNPVTNKIYIAAGVSWTQAGTVTVIDGSTNSTATVTAGIRPVAIAVNPVTNKIYVANQGCAGPLGCGYRGNITVIDGATNSTTTLHDPNANGPRAIAVNLITNRIYVANLWTGNITVIDGATGSVTTIKDPNVRMQSVAVAINQPTNKIYVVNNNREGFSNAKTGNITVIDGASNTTTTITDPNAMTPAAIAVNPATNEIYVANIGGDSGPNHGNITVIDGADHHTTTLTDPDVLAPIAIAVNSETNKIYVANANDSAGSGNGGITVIDGGTNSLTNVRDASALSPWAVAVDPIANKIYVANYGVNPSQSSNAPGNITVIDGPTNSLTDLVDPNAINPNALAVNPHTHRIYVANIYSDNATVIDGGNVAPPSAYQFVPVTPCRVADTRNPTSAFGGPEMTAGQTRAFNIPQSSCGIPSAAAYSLNVTVVPNGPLAFLTIWPSGEGQPYVSTLNSYDGRVKANAAIVPAGANGGVSVFVTDATQVILDIDGYFVPAGTSSALVFYPLTPCRIADTRNATGQLGGPFINGGHSRDFPILSSNCNVPTSAKAYSLNITALPHKTLNYLATWPTGKTQPYVSTLNSSTGTVTANAAIVPAGTSGEVSVFVSDNSDLILDVNGYFGPPGSGGLSLYTVPPRRLIDTRPNSYSPFDGVMTVNVEDLVTAPPAQAYVLNATVVPPGPLDYLSLWPDEVTQPDVSTLNAIDGAITSNMAIVATTNGAIDAYAFNSTNLILDLSSYFAP